MLKRNSFGITVLILSFLLVIPDTAKSGVGFWVGRTNPTFLEGDDSDDSLMISALGMGFSYDDLVIEPYPGMVLGIYTTTNISSWIGLRSNIQFVQKGAKLSYKRNPGINEYTEIILIRYSTLEMSFGPKIQVPLNTLFPKAGATIPFEPNAYIGGFLGVSPPFSPVQILQDGEAMDYEELYPDSSDFQSPIDIGYTYGFGCEWNTHSINLSFDVRRSVGILPVTLNGEDVKATHETTMVGVGILFGRK
ncbi:MAG: hypothetical protein P9L92_06775 [Candidatus Electryonea clarkiae]|nr:hypothetical protein [Candidatus Electryonea clarkiae]MDP8286703.1 hypothetical protein [Candidatus Electryonea clarkiae]